MTGITSFVYYPIGLVLFIFEGWLLSHILPFHAKAHVEELEAGRQVPLDGLRGLLALSVFFAHVISYYNFQKSGVWGFPASNWGAQLAIAPVSMFFFITGYLFWSKLRKGSRISKARFWFGRVARLMPVYFVACLIAFAFAASLSGFTLRVPATTLGMQLMSWIANVQMIDINGVADSRLWLKQGWTLRFEWMFYLSLPFLAWFARRVRYTLLLLCIAGMLTGFGQIALGSVGGSNFSRFVLTFLHYFIHTFSLGILVASFPLERFSAIARGTLATVVSLLLLGYVLALVPAKYGLLETSALAIPFACICLGNTWWGFLSSRSMRFLGRISYSFYLLHFVSFTILLNLASKFGLLVGIRLSSYWMLSFGAGSVIIAICAFSFQWLEHPFLHIGQSRNSFAIAGHASPHATVAAEAGAGTPGPEGQKPRAQRF